MNGPQTTNLLEGDGEPRASSSSFGLADTLSQLAVYSLVGYALIRGATALTTRLGNPFRETWDAMPQVLVAIGAGLFLLVAIHVVEHHSRLPTEYVRKLAHMGAGAIALCTPLLFDTHQPALLVTGIFTVALVIARRQGWLASLHGQTGRGAGDILFLWAAYLAFLLSEGSMVLFLTPVLVLTLADSTAALVGGRIGRTQWPRPFSGRTVEGSAAFCIVAFACVMLMVTVYTEMSLAQGVALSVLLGITTGAAEVVAKRGWDNLTVPVSTLVLLELLIK